VKRNELLWYSLVLLQLLNMSEQRFVELWILLFDFRREDSCFNLHLGGNHFQYLHKGWNPWVNAISIRAVLFGTGKPASQTTSVSVCPRREMTDEISALRTVPFFILCSISETFR
jgi:hypothetical protein